MAGSASPSGGLIAGINVTPLVDIMLVLLIVFLVTAKLVVTPPKGLPLDLPQSATGEPVQLVLALTLAADGAAAIDGERLLSDEDILPRARAVKAAHPDVRAVVQADGKVFHARVVHAVDLLSQAGVSQIAFGVTLTPAGAAEIGRPAAGSPR